jgi:endo-alpha-1,4-polygalactosaminidase (GH114 family)
MDLEKAQQNILTAITLMAQTKYTEELQILVQVYNRLLQVEKLEKQENLSFIHEDADDRAS